MAPAASRRRSEVSPAGASGSGALEARGGEQFSGTMFAPSGPAARRGPRPLPWLLLLLLGPGAVLGISFHLPVNSRKCLREEIHKDLLVTGSYEITDQPAGEGGLRTHLKVRPAQGPGVGGPPGPREAFGAAQPPFPSEAAPSPRFLGIGGAGPGLDPPGEHPRGAWIGGAPGGSGDPPCWESERSPAPEALAPRPGLHAEAAQALSWAGRVTPVWG